MKGKNKLILNQTSMQEALEYYFFNKLLRQQVIVEKVHEKNGQFEIDIKKDEEKDEEKEN